MDLFFFFLAIYPPHTIPLSTLIFHLSSLLSHLSSFIFHLSSLIFNSPLQGHNNCCTFVEIVLRFGKSINIYRYGTKEDT